MDIYYRIETGALFATWIVFYNWYWADRAYESEVDNFYGSELRFSTMLEF